MDKADAGLSAQRHGFNRKIVQPEFVVDTVSMEQIFLETLGFPSPALYNKLSVIINSSQTLYNSGGHRR